jgi:uncharacterized membrane protein
MENQNIKNYQFFFGALLVLIGILIFSFLSDPVRFFGFIFIVGAAIYFATISSSRSIGTNNEKFKSRTRDHILRHQHKRF